MINLPIFRAKWIDKKDINSKEFINDCAEGFYFEYLGKHFIRTNNSEPFAVEINPTTLAINFPDMIDSQGNKIFASLSQDGKGGDIVEYKLNDWKKAISVCRYKDKQIAYAQNEVKVVGIQQ